MAKIPFVTGDYLDTLHLADCKFDKSFNFVSDSQEVKSIKENLGEVADEFDSFFVKVGDGDYVEVWGIHGIIPFDSKLAFKIK
jgi:hypothetical protein